METLQLIIMAICSAILFVHFIMGIGQMSPETPCIIWLPLVAATGFDVGVFICSVWGHLEYAQIFGTYAFFAGGLYGLVLYSKGIKLSEILNGQFKKVS